MEASGGNANAGAGGPATPKIPVILIGERHETESCSVQQHAVLEELSSSVPREETLLVEEGYNPCINSIREKGYKILNEHAIPEIWDVLAIFRMYVNMMRDANPMIEMPMTKVFEKIPHGQEKLNEMYADLDKSGGLWVTRLDLYSKKVKLYEELRDYVSEETRPLLDIVIDQESRTSKTGMGPSQSSDEIPMMLTDLRDKLLVKAIENYVSTNPSIKIIVIIRGAFHEQSTASYIGASSRLALNRRSISHFGTRFKFRRQSNKQPRRHTRKHARKHTRKHTRRHTRTYPKK